MDLNKTTKYAIRIMSFMAADETKIYTANDIYEKLKIPFRYLRKQMTLLSKNGLIESIQGKNGGYKLSGDSNKISLFDIVSVTEKSAFNNECFFDDEKCNLKDVCVMHDKWMVIRNTISDVFKKTSLADIIESDSHQFSLNTNLLIT